MDPICHTLVGATLAQAGLTRRTTYGAAALLISANLPDVDALTVLGVRSDAALCFRRGWTHGVLAMAVLPLALAGALMLLHALRRRPDRSPPIRSQLIYLCYLGFLTHPFLDWLNTYGVRLLMPFDGQWFYGDALYIVDPWMWLMLGGAAFLGYSRRRTSLAGWALLALLLSTLVLTSASPGNSVLRVVWVVWVLTLVVLRIRRTRMAGPRREWVAKLALGATSVYVVAALGVTQYARWSIRQQLEGQGVVVERLMVGPLPGVPLPRDVVVETPDGYRYGTWTPLVRPALELAGRTIPRPGGSPFIEEAFHSPGAHCFMNWVRFPFAEMEETTDSVIVYLLDARYTRERSVGFGAWVVKLDPETGRPGP